MTVSVPARFRLTLPALLYCARLLPLRMTSHILGGVLRRNQKTFLNPGRMTRNLRAAFPELDKETAENLTSEIIANSGVHFAELVNAPMIKKGLQGTYIDIVNGPDMAFADHGPAIYVGAHVGSWELMPLIFEGTGRPISLVYSRNKNMDGLITKIIATLRSETGGKYYEKSKALKPLVAALLHGESVALLVEQRVETGIDVEFFGRTTKFTKMPAKLALKFNLPVIPFEPERAGPGQLRLTFHKAIRPIGPLGVRSETAITQEMAAVIEGVISRNRHTWFCNKLRWKEQPAAMAKGSKANERRKTEAVA